MLASLIPIDVHLTGGRAWWFDLIGPAMIAATAIVAAAIAARTANRRQAAQLKHDRQLQTEQLKYDREQRNRQHVRDVLDEAVKGVDSAVRCIIGFGSAVRRGDGMRTELRKRSSDSDTPDEVREIVTESLRDHKSELGAQNRASFDAVIELISDDLRLSLRLGSDHAIVKAQGKFREACAQEHRVAREIDLDTPVTDDQLAEMSEAAAATARAAGRFMSECQEWFREG